MTNDERPALSGAELEVLKALWVRGSGTVRQVNDLLSERGKTWAYTTVMTLLQRLSGKGYATIDESGPAYVYQPATSREELMRIRAQDVANELCGGATSTLVLNLMEGQTFNSEEISRLRHLVERLDSERGDPSAASDDQKPKRTRNRSPKP